ncbi:MAG: hypothetical protein Kow00127_15510 [Bacteroidales bacterium]
MVNKFRALALTLVLLPILLAGQDTLQVMYYNVLNFPGTTPGRIDYFRTVTSYIQPDVLLTTEVLSEAGADDLLNSGLNAWGTQNYARAEFTDGPDTDNMLFYNSDKLTLYSQDTIQTALRLINEYVLWYSGAGAPGNDTLFVTFYVAHLKASSGSTNEEKRMKEVMRLKAHLSEKSNTENIIFGGDLNLYSAQEPAYDSIISAGPVPFSDPLPAGNWHNNSSFSSIHTQSTRTTYFGGGSTGGMDDRFDFIFFSPDMMQPDAPVMYETQSCTAFGNDGQHFNLALVDPPANNLLPDSAVQALYQMSDHLPVISNLIVTPPVTHLPSGPFVAKAFLEGVMSGNSMYGIPSALLPATQPFQGAPWFYTGTEMNTVAPSSMVTDWFLLELYEGTSPSDAITHSPVFQVAGLLLPDGSLTGPDGIQPVLIPELPNGDYYPVLRFRNHLALAGQTPLAVNEQNQYTYDYTAGPSAVEGASLCMVEYTPGVWAAAAGDLNADGVISVTDIHPAWSDEAGKSGFRIADLNLDFQVNNIDKNNLIIKNLGKYSILQP